MKRNFKSKSKSKGKDKIKVKTSQNTDRKKPTSQIPQLKPIPINQLQDIKEQQVAKPQPEIKDQRAKEIDELFKGADNPPKYDFNLHKHLKENLKFKDKQCKDGLTKDSLYCLDCKLSTCPKCPNLSSHNGHSVLLKYPYYICKDNTINENFENLDKIFELNLDFLDVDTVKEEKDIYYSHVFKKDDNEGIVNVYFKEKNSYLVVLEYNHAKVEVYVKKQDINDAVANAIIITSSINYNKNIIQNMIGKDLTTVEEEVNVFEIKDDSSSTLQIDDTYHEDEKYDSEIIR